MFDRGPVIDARDLAVGYRGGPVVLEDVTFAVAPGERVGILGPNGGGKTTLMRALLGELAPRAGSLAVHGSRGTVPQTERSRLDYPVSALDVVLMGALAGRPWWRRPGRAERAAALATLERVGLADRARTTFGELSGGQRQRVLVARALLQDAEIILFDEPFTGLDAPSTARLLALIDELAGEGRCVLVCTHDVAQARAWDHVLCLNRRQIDFGPPEHALTAEVLGATYEHALVRVPAAPAAAPRDVLSAAVSPPDVAPAGPRPAAHVAPRDAAASPPAAGPRPAARVAPRDAAVSPPAAGPRPVARVAPRDAAVSPPDSAPGVPARA